jgi:Sulfatase
MARGTIRGVGRTGFTSRRIAAALVALLVVIGGLAASELNLLVITLDTTRADRLGAYGGPQGATPELDRIAAEGVLFEHASAPAPLTLPAHASLFTSKYPPAVRDNGGFFLDERETTLAERLKSAGFRRADSSAPTSSIDTGESRRASTPTSTTSISRNSTPRRSAMSNAGQRGSGSRARMAPDREVVALFRLDPFL